MKTANILYTGLLLAGLQIISSCSKDFLETDPRGTTLEINYYQTPAEAFNGLVAAYDPLGVEVGSSYISRVGVFNSPSDDAYAGGGSSSDVPNWQVWSNFTVNAGVGPQGDLWNRNYTGVYRTNLLLSKLESVPGLDAATKSRYTAEAKFLRGYYYFDLVRLFKNIPLFTAPIPTADIFNVLQAKPEDVYAQIEKDLAEARAGLPVTVIPAENGRVTKGAASALLGKVILYQNNNSRMLEAANLFREVNTSPAYSLQTNFGDIFRPDNEFNSESVFEIVHTNAARQDWGSWGNFEGNVGVQMFGPRAYSGPIYEAGWGFNPLTMSLVNALKTDPRYGYTVANIDSIAQAGSATYEAGYQNTGYFIEKYAPKKQWKSTLGGEPVLNYPHNYMEIRLADVYLMEAEALVRGNGDLSRAAFLLNEVRDRVGLGPIAATLDNIYQERRLELATEGHRFFDLVRTGRAASVLGFKGFQAGKHEILPIPLSELNNTKLVQNPGYN